MRTESVAAAPDIPLRQFARDFFRALGAPITEAERDVWHVELNPDQRALLDPHPPLPWWALPPTPPESVRWTIAFDGQAAARHPDARLLTRRSHLFFRMAEAAKKLGLVYTATAWQGSHRLYRPLLWMHMRVTQRGDHVEQFIEPWVCDLSRGSVEKRPLPPLERLQPGPPPAGTIDRMLLQPREVWDLIVSAITDSRERRGDDWARAATTRMEQEAREVRLYYESLAADGDSGERDADTLTAEMARRMAEIRGRHFPRLIIEPVAATLVYTPDSMAGEPDEFLGAQGSR